MTFRQFVRELVVAKQNREERHDYAMSYVWHTALLTRCDHKDFPKLDKFLGKTNRKQTPAEMAAMWQVIAARYGGTLQPLDPNTVIVRGQ